MNAKQTPANLRRVRFSGFLIKPKDQPSAFRDFTRYEKQYDEDFGLEIEVAVESFHSFTLLQKDRENPDDQSKQRWIRCRFYGTKAPEECQPNDLVQVTGTLCAETYTDRKTHEEKVARFVKVEGIETIWRRGAKKHSADNYDGPQESADLPNDSAAPVNPATAAQVASLRAEAAEKKAEEAAEAVKTTAKARKNVEHLKSNPAHLSPEAHAAALKAARERLQQAEENEKRTASQLASLKRQAALG